MGEGRDSCSQFSDLKIRKNTIYSYAKKHYVAKESLNAMTDAAQGPADRPRHSPAKPGNSAKKLSRVLEGIGCADEGSASLQVGLKRSEFRKLNSIERKNQMLIQGNQISTPSTDLNAQNTQQHLRRSAISYLSPQKAQQHLQRTMNRRIRDVANGPSSSNNNFLNGLIALKNRDYQNAPGSNLVLSHKGGLPGGGKRVDAYQTVSSSSSANNYRAYTTRELEFQMGEAARQVFNLTVQIREMPEGSEKREAQNHLNTLEIRCRNLADEVSRRARNAN
jgi:hypothetical protein